jgi:hypothetical protein
MTAEKSNVVISVDPTAGGSVVHHTSFPEIRAEGSSPQDACERLVNKLTRTLDTALSKWRREEINKAIEDVKAFASETP